MQCTALMYLPRTLAFSWFLKGPKNVRTEDRAEIATTRHTGGPEQASAPNVSASSAEHCSNVICEKEGGEVREVTNE